MGIYPVWMNEFLESGAHETSLAYLLKKKKKTLT